MLKIKDVYDIEEAAKYLNLTPRALKALCREKRIAFSKVDYRTWRFCREDLEDFIRRNRVEPGL